MSRRNADMQTQKEIVNAESAQRHFKNFSRSYVGWNSRR